MADNAISVLAELDSEETGKIIREAAAGRKPAGFKSVFDSARGRLEGAGLGKIGAAMLSGIKSKTRAA